MSSFDICNMEDFVAEVTPQAGSLEEAASTQEILIQQIEGFLNRMRESICTDVEALQVSINNIVPGAGLPNLVDNVEVSSGRQVNGFDTFFKLRDIGTLPNAGTNTVAHNIGAAFALVAAYGVANDPVAPSSIPLVFVTNSAATTHIWFHTDATNIIIVTGTDRTVYTNSFIVLEYYYL